MIFWIFVCFSLFFRTLFEHFPWKIAKIWRIFLEIFEICSFSNKDISELRKYFLINFFKPHLLCEISPKNTFLGACVYPEKRYPRNNMVDFRKFTCTTPTWVAAGQVPHVARAHRRKPKGYRSNWDRNTTHHHSMSWGRCWLALHHHPSCRYWWRTGVRHLPSTHGSRRGRFRMWLGLTDANQRVIVRTGIGTQHTITACREVAAG